MIVAASQRHLVFGDVMSTDARLLTETLFLLSLPGGVELSGLWTRIIAPHVKTMTVTSRATTRCQKQY